MRLHATTRVFKDLPKQLQILAANDDVLKIRAWIQSLPSLEEYQDQILLLTAHAVKSGAWYSARYLVSLNQTARYTSIDRSDLLWAALDCREPKMLDLAYTDRDTLACVSSGGVTVPEYILGEAMTGMADVLAAKCNHAWDSITVSERTQWPSYDGCATIQVLTGNPDNSQVDPETVCEQLLHRERIRLDIDQTIFTAVLINDWILLDHLSQFYPTEIQSTLGGSEYDGYFTELLFAAAQANAAKALVAIGAYIDYDKLNRQGDALLHVAARHGCISTVELLLYSGADPIKANSKNKTPLDCVFESKSPSLRCAALIAGLMDADSLTHSKYSPKGDNSELDAFHQVLHHRNWMRQEFQDKGLLVV